MSRYAPIHVHDCYSLLDGLSKPAQNVGRAIRIGAPAIAITNHGSVASVPEFFRAAKNACKTCGLQAEDHSDNKGKCLKKDYRYCQQFEPAVLKTIAGNEFYLCPRASTQKDSDNRGLSHLCVLAKNQQGWKNLMTAASASNHPTRFYYKPRLTLEELGGYAQGQFVAFSGHPGSDMANIIFPEPKLAYRARSVDEARMMLKDRTTLKADMMELADRYVQLFGKENFFLEVQLIDGDKLPASKVIAECVRRCAELMGIPTVCTPDAHYPERKDAPDQRVLLCSAFNTTFKRVEAAIARDEDITLGGFFRSDSYHIPEYEEFIKAGSTPGELANSLLIADMCESYRLDSPPRLPDFATPEGMTDAEYVKKICREGWTKKLSHVPKDKFPIYAERFDREFRMFTDYSLHQYFLVVWDMLNYSKTELGCIAAPGRGSVGGTLIGYLMDIHDCDPIQYELVLERFFNPARSTPSHISFEEYPLDKITTY